MKLKFKAFGTKQPVCNVIEGRVNNFDISEFPEGGQFVGNDATLAAGIYDASRINGELFVTVAQCGLAYQCTPINGSHDWAESDWIDAANYNPDTCYIIATSAPESAEYHRTDDGWTVKLPEQEVIDELV
ncbi:hypothetical protein [Oceanimonas smirnovii]|uniref:hypothetical protein n=1 Tax=Oceanimonas smirnovii TaxID=264574 RepID=UPI003FD0F305